MIRAFYSASSGMVAQSIKQDVIANNIANAQTTGFKRNRVATASFQQALEQSVVALMDVNRPAYPDSPVRPVIAAAESAVDASEGPIRNTGNKLDFAIDGPGAFEVVSSSGVSQTRAGSFHVDASKELCAIDGAKVQGNSGNIHIPEGKLEVAPDGTISVNGAQIDKIKVTGEKPGETKLVQGALEEANVNVVRELTDMIANMRAFEANQRVIGNIDRTLEKLINEGGRV